ncbi:MAG: hypothetical protein OER22_09780 [Gammaproteobacteria bacterium]|nr:hypothetical protein [Gammaproteobacteria bacterium]MDH3552888.1 hypothetical protein [Gammaproteobacteria bacterium]
MRRAVFTLFIKALLANIKFSSLLTAVRVTRRAQRMVRLALGAAGQAANRQRASGRLPRAIKLSMWIFVT